MCGTFLSTVGVNMALHYMFQVHLQEPLRVNSHRRHHQQQHQQLQRLQQQQHQQLAHQPLKPRLRVLKLQQQVLVQPRVGLKSFVV